MRHLPNVWLQKKSLSVSKFKGVKKTWSQKKNTPSTPFCGGETHCLFVVCWPRDIALTSLASHVSWNENWTRMMKMNYKRTDTKKPCVNPTNFRSKNATMDLPCCKVTSYLYGFNYSLQRKVVARQTFPLGKITFSRANCELREGKRKELNPSNFQL